MSLVTFTTDFGPNSIYTATSSAGLLGKESVAGVIDLSHTIEPNNIAEAAYLVHTVYPDYPDGTIHIIAVDQRHRTRNPELVIRKIKQQYFISYNTGLLSMIEEEPNATYWIAGTYDGRHFTSIYKVLNQIALQIARNDFSGFELVKADKVMQKSTLRPAMNDEEIAGNVMYFDERGFAYTNIHQSDFERFAPDGRAVIRLTRFETLEAVLPHLSGTSPGSAGAFFNDRGYLCIGIYHDDTRSLLGFKRGHVILIEHS